MNRTLTWILLASLVALVCLSIHLAATRIYQADECMELAVTKILASGQVKPGNIGLLQFPLAWAVRGAARSADFFVSARFVMVAIFWLNLILIALATGERLFSRRGLVALMGAATLAPLWDYGFEIRHDNLLLTGMLLTWLTARVHPQGTLSYLIAGGLAVAMQFTAHKAFVYTVPLSLAILAFPPPAHEASRWRLAVAWIIGAVATMLALRLAYAACDVGGIWEARKEGFDFVSKVATSGDRFGPGFALVRLLHQTPLLLALLAPALLAVAVDLRRHGRAALTWEGSLPEALLFAGAFAALVVNPTPFVYNLLHLVPYAFLFAFRYAARLSEEILDCPSFFR